VDKCCRLLTSHNVVTVRGNHDRWFLTGLARELPDATLPASVSAESRGVLERLPPMVEIETISGRALLCHGLGPNDMAKVTPDDFGYALDANDDLQKLIRNSPYRWILNGHSHRQMIRDFNGLTIVNAGTLRRADSPCFFELDFETSVALLFEVDSSGRIGTSPRRMRLPASPTPI
jgi:predicted phosphodiesterase